MHEMKVVFGLTSSDVATLQCQECFSNLSCLIMYGFHIDDGGCILSYKGFMLACVDNGFAVREYTTQSKKIRYMELNVNVGFEIDSCFHYVIINQQIN